MLWGNICGKWVWLDIQILLQQLNNTEYKHQQFYQRENIDQRFQPFAYSQMLCQIRRFNRIVNQQYLNKRMNIKISMKNCDCSPTVANIPQMQEVQHKKKSMLYGAPERDKKKTVNKKNQQISNANRRGIDTNSQQYRQSEKQMLNELKKNGKNTATLDMVNNTNNILQRQSQILQQNQRTINNISTQNGRGQPDSNAVKEVKQALIRLEKEMNEMNKIRTQIKETADHFNKTLMEMKKGKPGNNQQVNQIPQMNQLNSNLKDLVSISKNHLQGIQNLEALKHLQNFNMEGYAQAINSIKKQIAQYQRESENIERELKIRAAKLEKLEISPKFEEELYKPYQEHLNNRINSIDLHSIRERVYDKIGTFDYGKFEYDVGDIVCEAKKQLGNFSIVCKEHEIRVPDIKLDMRELKQLDTKAPSVLDQYKAARGIVFENKKQNSEKLANNTGNLVRQSRLKKTNAVQDQLKNLKGNAKPPTLRNITSKPIDNSNNTRLIRDADKPQTVLENKEKKQKREIEQRVRKSSKQKRKEDEDFDRYLQNRAKEELELIYKQRNQRLKKMQEQLQETCKEPLTFIQLNLDKRQLRNSGKKQSPKKKSQEEKQEDEYDQEFENQEEQQKKPQNQNAFESREQNSLRQATRDALKQKLHGLLKQKNRPSSQQRNQSYQARASEEKAPSDPNRQVQNMAEGFVNLINNSLTQINANLATAIERRVVNTNSQQKRNGSVQRKQAKRIQIPKLEEFRPPPIFNATINQPPMQPPMQPQIYPHLHSYSNPQPYQPPAQNKQNYKKSDKIKQQDFNELRYNKNESYSDLDISSFDENDNI